MRKRGGVQSAGDGGEKMRESQRQVVENARILKLVYAGVLTAVGIVLPQAFHIFGQSAGGMFLPIHLPILMAGVLLGGGYGLGVGILVPILSSVLTGMPPVPKVYFMLFETAVYGLTAGVLAERKYPVYLRLIPAMVAGRVAYGLSLIVGVYIFNLHFPFANGTVFVSGIVSGIPGIIIQLIVIPVLFRVLKKAGLTFENETEV